MKKKEKLASISEALKDHIFSYMKSDGIGGKLVIGAFMEEFQKLSERSPENDPTNISKHMNFILEHVKNTWDASIAISETGEISVGVGKDEVLGYTEDRTKLLHNPVPVAWVVYLIKGIGGKYAFVDPAAYAKKHRRAMPAVYHGGFLISKNAWIREGWSHEVGPFESYEHPASGASPIPFFRNVMERIDMEIIISTALDSFDPDGGKNATDT